MEVFTQVIYQEPLEQEELVVELVEVHHLKLIQEQQTLVVAEVAVLVLTQLLLEVLEEQVDQA